MGSKIFTILLILLTCWPLSLSAQVDFRNSDRGRPILIEDAYPIEYLAFELQGGIQYERREGENGLGFKPEFRFGGYKNLQIGVEADYNSLWNEKSRSGISDTIVHLLYNFNQEGLNVPALAVRLDGGLPTGGLGTDNFHASGAVLATKTLGYLRLHSNLSYTLGPTSSEGQGLDISRYFYGIGFDYTWPLRFIMIMGDVVAKKPIDGEKAEVALEFGTRMQFHPKFVFDVGIGTGALREDGSNVIATVGLTYIFGVRRVSLGSIK